FRTIHTIKGTSGFFGFDILGSITHIAENILSQLRSRQRKLTPELTSLILEVVDAIKAILGRIEAENQEGEDVYQDLKTRLEAVAQMNGGNVTPSAAPVALSNPTAGDSQSVKPTASTEPGNASPRVSRDPSEKTAAAAPASANEVPQSTDE